MIVSTDGRKLEHVALHEVQRRGLDPNSSVTMRMVSSSASGDGPSSARSRPSDSMPEICRSSRRRAAVVVAG
jgi:hypothetical protein